MKKLWYIKIEASEGELKGLGSKGDEPIELNAKIILLCITVRLGLRHFELRSKKTGVLFV